jgi:membrane protein DedA with SNARE-associated domain
MQQPEWIAELIVFLGGLIDRYGLLGIAAAMFAESAGVPFASAVVIATAGSLIFSGKFPLWLILVASTLGITAGSVCSYCIGLVTSKMGCLIKDTLQRRLPDRSKRKVKLSSPHRSKVYALWEKYGSFSIFMGQLWGVTRTFISFPAGAMHMNILLFIIYTALGGALFSLGAVGVSLLLTGFMGLILSHLHFMLSLSPWLWVGLVLILVAMIILYRRYHFKISIASIGRRLKGWVSRK